MLIALFHTQKRAPAENVCSRDPSQGGARAASLRA